MLGDSLSAAYGMPIEAGWVQLLATRLSEHSPPVEVINVSVSGETTAGGATRISSLLTQHTPSHVLVFLGGNDGLRGILPDETRGNLEAIIGEAARHHASVGLIPVRLPTNLGQVYLKRIEVMYQTVCAATPVRCFAFPWERVALDPSLMQPDGIHPNQAAQPVILDSLWPAISLWLSDAQPGGAP